MARSRKTIPPTFRNNSAFVDHYLFLLGWKGKLNQNPGFPSCLSTCVELFGIAPGGKDVDYRNSPNSEDRKTESEKHGGSPIYIPTKGG